MAAAEFFESEQKYDVETATPLPALLDIPGIDRAADPVEDRLEAVYFDTATLVLAARRITLRRSTGGTDHGWHLKFPAGDDRSRAVRVSTGRMRKASARVQDSSAEAPALQAGGTGEPM